ncbi:transposase [Neobacillus bataviensis]|uniref:IS110 family transposase n=1 Tax=Neobacillus bataviensis TaxID=220685 RepID=UPI0037CA1C0E
MSEFRKNNIYPTIYWINLSKWLFKQRIEVVTVNPHLVKKNKENRDNTQSKSDKKDALVIADIVKNGYYSDVRNTSEPFEKLRVLMSNRDVVVKRLASSINQLNSTIGPFYGVLLIVKIGGI